MVVIVLRSLSVLWKLRKRKCERGSLCDAPLLLGHFRLGHLASCGPVFYCYPRLVFILCCKILFTIILCICFAKGVNGVACHEWYFGMSVCFCYFSD